MKNTTERNVSPREAAYLAYLAAERGECFIAEFLETRYHRLIPLKKDFKLAMEIACGTCRMASSLEEYANRLVGEKLTLKRKEKTLLFTALYQYYFLEKIPLYAIADESVRIAKKYCHSRFVKFLNAILRKIPETQVSLPEEKTKEALAIRYSYPIFFIEQLLGEYGIEKTGEILKAGNSSGPTLARIRTDEKNIPYSLFPDKNISMAIIPGDEVEQVGNSPDYYIQNITPASLMNFLAESKKTPERILDMCSAPGGKLIAAHDLYPKAKLYANDVSEEKIGLVKNNIDKYGIEAILSVAKGEELLSDEKFDLIILDVPCSNTGVLYKRPEARWRLNAENIQNLKELQKKILAHSANFLKENGEIWYMTCSVLKEENEDLVAEMAGQLGLSVGRSLKILPDAEGRDGGYACALYLK